MIIDRARRRWIGLAAGLVLTLVGCTKAAPPPSQVPATLTLPPVVPTSTSIPPSPSPVPLAARVNGEGITLEEYQAELTRYQAAIGTELATEDEQRVLDELVGELLLAQAAGEAGYTPDEAEIQARTDDLVTALGSQQALQDWMARYHYSRESFQQALGRSVAAAWMRDHIATGVPESAEQVHARQILLYNSEEADGVLAQLRAGADFDDLAAQNDPITGGDLGWFPQGYLLDPKLDEAAFGLQPGEFSSVIQTAAGYHILQVLERVSQRMLEPSARKVLQVRAIEDWMNQRRSQSEIQLLP